MRAVIQEASSDQTHTPHNGHPAHLFARALCKLSPRDICTRRLARAAGVVLPLRNRVVV